MRIDVVGGGSLGLLYGAKLADAGADVTIWTRSEKQALLVAEQGIRLIELGGTSERLIRVRSEWMERASERRWMKDQNLKKADYRWVLLTVKQTDLDDRLLERLAQLTNSPINDGTAMLCLQNGIGHLEQIQSKLPNMPLHAAVTTEGAKRLDSRTVEHTGRGQLWLGKWGENGRKENESLVFPQNMLVSMLQSAGFASFLSNDLENRIFHKLLINAVINPLTAIFDVENGQLPEHPIREKLMRELYAESELILVNAGMSMPKDGWQLIIDVCRQTSRNISSMLSDVRAGRVTEIDAINGGVARLAGKQGLEAPLNRAITELVQALHPKLNGRE
ncbi:ketopantoate reductase family protein [Paenibacillus sp. FJAT-27812]|uniref:ketopantoate reductase family protein n=1 Tax=Paenibacillus sp. FJAT-27812 TaxID=1684143 RepID=UPI0006A7C3C4|nr:2-dehydropantoate 2-reductase [Paenibacillus sp. FJAT-27812]